MEGIPLKNQENVAVGGNCNPKHSFSINFTGDFVCNGIKYLNPKVRKLNVDFQPHSGKSR